MIDKYCNLMGQLSCTFFRLIRVLVHLTNLLSFSYVEFSCMNIYSIANLGIWSRDELFCF